jgi:hypothetical protein
MAIETTLKVNGDSTDAQRDQRNLREDLEETGDAIERIGRESREMGREVGQGARQAERALESLERQAREVGEETGGFTTRVAEFAGGILTAELATQAFQKAVELVGGALSSYIETSESAQRAQSRLTQALERTERAFAQGAFGDGRAEAAMLALADSADIAADSFQDSEGVLAGFSEAWIGANNELNRSVEYLLDTDNALWSVTEGLRNISPYVAVFRHFEREGEAAAASIRGVGRSMTRIIEPQSGPEILDFFADVTGAATSAASRTEAFRRQIESLTGIDFLDIEPDDPADDDRAATARVEREESVLDDIKRKRDDARAEEYQAMLEAQEREAELMAERKARLDEIAMLRAEQDEERAAMAEEKAMMLQDREIERMEALAQKEEEIQQRRRDAVSAYLGGFDQQVADAIVGSQSLEDAMRATFGGIASAAADAAMAQAGILAFTPGGQAAAIGLLGAAITARVIASALGYQGGAAGGAGGGGQTVRNTQVSVTVAGQGGNGQTGRAVAESVRDAIERGAA